MGYSERNNRNTKEPFVFWSLILMAGICAFLFSDNVSKKGEIAQLESKVAELTCEEVELDPCPICHMEVEIDPIDDSFYIECDECGLELRFYKSKAEITELWNSIGE